MASWTDYQSDSAKRHHVDRAYHETLRDLEFGWMVNYNQRGLAVRMVCPPDTKDQIGHVKFLTREEEIDKAPHFSWKYRHDFSFEAFKDLVKSDVKEFEWPELSGKPWDEINAFMEEMQFRYEKIDGIEQWQNVWPLDLKDKIKLSAVAEKSYIAAFCGAMLTDFENGEAKEWMKRLVEMLMKSDDLSDWTVNCQSPPLHCKTNVYLETIFGYIENEATMDKFNASFKCPTLNYCSSDLSLDRLSITSSGDHSEIKSGLKSLSRDVNRTTGSLLSIEERNDLTSIIDEMIGDVENKIQLSESRTECQTFVANRPQLVHVGSPRFQITKEQLEFLSSYKFSAPMMAETLHTSESTIRRRLRENNIKLRDGKQTEISDQDLDQHVREIIGTNRQIGPNTIRLRLLLDNINVSRQRVRDSCQRVDPVGCSLRSLERQNVQRRTYKVAGPNSLWHIDGNHKLIRWGVVIHGGIDGYSRRIIFLNASNNNKAITVFDLFTDASKQYGIPSRIRVDHGIENVDICIFMEGYRGENRGSAIKGKSCHNQRIERLWVDLWYSISNEYYSLFTYMEESDLLDLESAMHVWAFQYVFIPRINKSLSMFESQYNSHGLSTENFRTPYQIFIQEVLKNMHSNNTSIQDSMIQSGNIETEDNLRQNDYNYYGVEDMTDELDTETPEVRETNLRSIHCPLNEQQMEHLKETFHPVANYKKLIYGVDIYKNVLTYLESEQEH